MSDVHSAETAAVTAAKVKGKSSPKKVWPKKLAKQAEGGKDGFDFVGRVEGINVKGAGPNSHQFLFSLINKKGDRHPYLLDPSEPLQFSTMANLLTAAFAAGTKVRIRTTPNPGGPAYVGELEVQIKP